MKSPRKKVGPSSASQSSILDQECIVFFYFQKMNVNLARSLFSRTVSDGLRFLVQNEGYSEEILTTAKFIEVISRWFELVNSRHPNVAISKKNIEEYTKAIEHLEDIKTLFHNMYVYL